MEYIPKWHCSYCGSYDVESIESARFDPNNDMAFLEMVESCAGSDWCNACNCETSFDECKVTYEAWKKQDRLDTLMKEPNNE